MRCLIRPFGVLAFTLTIAGAHVAAGAETSAARTTSKSTATAQTTDVASRSSQTRRKPSPAASTRPTQTSTKSARTKTAETSSRRRAAPTTSKESKRPASSSARADLTERTRKVRRTAHTTSTAQTDERGAQTSQSTTTTRSAAPSRDERVMPSQYVDRGLGLNANLPVAGGRPHGGWTMASMQAEEVMPIEPLPDEDPAPWLDDYMGEIVPMYGYLGGWRPVAGAEVLWIQPHFSEFRALQQTTTTMVGAATQAQVNDIDFDPGYDAGFRGYLGLRNGCCGDEIQFGYWNFSSAAQQSATATSTTDYCDFVCNSTANPGDTIVTDFGLNGNVYDIAFYKPLMTCPPTACGPCGGCGSCDSCVGGCGDCCGPVCPPWSIRWMAGLRVADIGHNLNSIISTSSGSTVAYAQSNASFTGFGPRIGLEGRRFFGAGRLSAYGRGSGSLLVGNYTQQITNYNTTPFVATTISDEKVNRVIPVAEIEIGGTYQVTRRLFVSGGWMVQSWWDLGLQEIAGGYDDSNILGLDGFFLRFELFF